MAAGGFWATGGRGFAGPACGAVPAGGLAPAVRWSIRSGIRPAGTGWARCRERSARTRATAAAHRSLRRPGPAGRREAPGRRGRSRAPGRPAPPPPRARRAGAAGATTCSVTGAGRVRRRSRAALRVARATRRQRGAHRRRRGQRRAALKRRHRSCGVRGRRLVWPGRLRVTSGDAAQHDHHRQRCGAEGLRRRRPTDAGTAAMPATW